MSFLLLFSLFMQFEPHVIFLLKMFKFLREQLLAQFSIFFNGFCCNVFVWLFSRCRYKNYKKVLSIDKVRKLALFECILQITLSFYYFDFKQIRKYSPNYSAGAHINFVARKWLWWVELVEHPPLLHLRKLSACIENCSFKLLVGFTSNKFNCII